MDGHVAPHSAPRHRRTRGLNTCAWGRCGVVEGGRGQGPWGLTHTPGISSQLREKKMRAIVRRACRHDRSLGSFMG
jgi:hypothetical protein